MNNSTAVRMEIFSPSRQIIRRNPDLCVELGDPDAADLLLQLDYWVRTEGVLFNGYWWIKASAAKIQQRALRYLSERTVRRKVDFLIERDLIVVTDEFNSTAQDKKRWFRLNELAVSALQSIVYAPSSPYLHKMTDTPDLSDTLSDPSVKMSDPPSVKLSDPSVKMSDDSLYKDSYIEDAENQKTEEILNEESDEAPSKAISWPARRVTNAEIEQPSLNETENLIMDELSRITCLDRALLPEVLYKPTKTIFAKGYGVDDLKSAEDEWRRDFRGAKGDIPTCREVMEMLGRVRRQARHNSQYGADKGDYSAFGDDDENDQARGL
jgi:hypothetical protein